MGLTGLKGQTYLCKLGLKQHSWIELLAVARLVFGLWMLESILSGMKILCIYLSHFFLDPPSQRLGKISVSHEVMRGRERARAWASGLCGQVDNGLMKVEMGWRDG